MDTEALKSRLRRTGFVRIDVDDQRITATYGGRAGRGTVHVYEAGDHEPRETRVSRTPWRTIAALCDEYE